MVLPRGFGSDEACDILKNDFNVGEYPDYEGNLGDVREYIYVVEDEVRAFNLCWSWLNMLRPLTGNADRTGYLFFMRNAAWTRKELRISLFLESKDICDW